MSDIDEKLDQCRLGLEDVTEMRVVQDVPRLLARFTGYVSNVSAVRQYLQNELRGALRSSISNDAQRWLQSLEEDRDVAGTMGLRHIDQHQTLIRVDRRVATFGINEFIPTTDRRPVAWVIKAGQPDPGPAPSPPFPSPAAARSTEVNASFEYFSDPRNLPDFMKAHNAMNYGRIPGQKRPLKKGDDLPHKAAVAAYVLQTDLIDLAERAYAALTSAITDAKARSILQL